MEKRNKKAQTSHNKGVMHEAEELKQKGWNVLADIKGYKKPWLINNRRPDVIAKKRGHTRIVEIETDVNDDYDQHDAFRNYANVRHNTIFYGWIVNREGIRKAKFNQLKG